MRGGHAALVTALVLSPGARAEDYVQRAREAMEMRDLASAFRYIKSEIGQNPRNWVAYRLLGEYYLRGLQQSKGALDNFQKAWDLAGGERPQTSQKLIDEYRSLGEDLTRLYTERVAQARTVRGDEGGLRVLERAIVENRFYSLPLVRQLLETYDRMGRAADVDRVASSMPHKDDRIAYSKTSADWGWIAYYHGRAAMKLSDPLRAYNRFRDAIQEGVDVGQAGAKAAEETLVKSHGPAVDQARALYGKKSYWDASKILAETMRKLPADIDLTQQSKDLLARCRQGIDISETIREVLALKEEKKFDEALTRAHKALDSFPMSEELREIYGQLFNLRAKIEKDAQRAAEETEHKEKEFQRAYMARLGRGAENERAGNPCEAAEAYREALKLKRSGDIEDKVKFNLQRCQVQERFQQGMNFHSKQMIPAAVKEFKWVLENDPSFRDGESLRYLALCYFDLGSTEEARDLAERYVEGHEDPEILAKLAEVYEKGDSRTSWERALELYRKVERSRGSDPVLRGKISALNWQIHRVYYIGVGVALGSYLLVYVFLKQRPKLVKKVLLADLERFIQRREYKSATELHSRVLDLPLTEREEVMVRGHLARAFFEVGEFSRAVNECQQVLRAGSENKQVRVLMAKALYGTKTISPEVLPFYLDLLEAEPQNKEICQFVGTFCAKKKIVNSTTVPVLRALANLTPDDDKLRDLLVKIYLKENDRSPSALSLFEVEKKKNPRNLDVRVALAEEYLKKGEVPRAVEECEEILNQDIYHRRTHQVLVDAYTKTGKVQELIKTYESILEGDPHNAVVASFLQKLVGGQAADTSASRISQPGSRAAARAAPTAVETAQEAGAAGAQAPEAPAGGERGTQPCPRCGKKVPVGTYFCACGQPLA